MPIIQQIARSLIHTFGKTELRQAPLLSSSIQAACLSPVRVCSSAPIYGPVAGVSLTTGAPWCHSLHGAYSAGIIKAPNAVILGAYNSAKSSLAKCVYALRVLGCGGRVAVFDRKNQRDGRTSGGEYLRLADVVDGQPIIFDRRPGRGSTINILDPVLSSVGSEESTVGQDELLMMAAELACGYQLVDTATSAPAYALRAAHRQALAVCRAQGRVATLPDVIAALYDPSPESIPGPDDPDGAKLLALRDLVTREDVTRWGLPVALGLERFITGDLSGLVGGPTCAPDGSPLDLSAPLLVFDTSALTEGSEALGFIVAVASAYISAKWAEYPGAKVLINEEAYFTDRLKGVPAILRAIAKRGRATGLGVVTLIHHLSDFRVDSDLVALIKETDVVHIFRQDKTDDVEQVIAFFDLPPALRPVIRTLPNGVHVLRMLNRPVEIIEHVRSPIEQWLTNTDDAMMSTALVGGETP